MTKLTLFIATTLSVAAVAFFIGFTLWEKKQLEFQQLEGQLTKARQAALESHAAAEQLQSELQVRETRIDTLLQEQQQAVAAQSKLEQEMRAALESKEISISEREGKLTVNILDRILFDSGEAVLKPEGEQVLEKIATILEQFPNRQIHVVGHTDNIPIRAAARNRFPSNWELSTARATAAVRFLQEKAGVDPQRLGAVGYGEFQPIADNATPEGRAQNRRIAIVVLPGVLVDRDAPLAENTTPNPDPQDLPAPPVPSAKDPNPTEEIPEE